jgi:hypothetical protein
MHQDERATQELQVKEGLYFGHLEKVPQNQTEGWDPVLQIKPSVPQGADPITQTEAIPTLTKQSSSTGQS